MEEGDGRGRDEVGTKWEQGGKGGTGNMFQVILSCDGNDQSDGDILLCSSEAFSSSYSPDTTLALLQAATREAEDEAEVIFWDVQ